MNISDFVFRISCFHCYAVGGGYKVKTYEKYAAGRISGLLYISDRELKRVY